MTTKEFIQYAGERRALCEKMAACTEIETAYAIAQAEGLTDDIETFKTVMAATRKEAENISDADLEKVIAAGTSTITQGVIAFSGVASATAVAAAAGCF